MDLSINWRLTSDDNQAWLGKLIAVIIASIIYGLEYFFSSNFSVPVVTIAVLSLMLCLLTEVRGINGLIMIALAILVIALVILKNNDLAHIATILTACYAVVAIIQEELEISLFSNITSSIMQFALTYLGFYIAQHLLIHLSFNWL